MKRMKTASIKVNRTASYAEFLRYFNIQLLTELKNRGFITALQYQKELTLFGEEV